MPRGKKRLKENQEKCDERGQDYLVQCDKERSSVFTDRDLPSTSEGQPGGKNPTVLPSCATCKLQQRLA